MRARFGVRSNYRVNGDAYPGNAASGSADYEYGKLLTKAAVMFGQPIQAIPLTWEDHSVKPVSVCEQATLKMKRARSLLARIASL